MKKNHATILQKDRLKVNAGESILITGNCGCGKTTLLNDIISQIEKQNLLVAINSMAFPGVKISNCSGYIILHDDWDLEDLMKFGIKIFLEF